MIVLTFDTDWMTPSAMDQFIAEYPALPISSFFIHAATGAWRAAGHENGPHPTFNALPQSVVGDGVEVSFLAEGIRSHSCVNSHLLSRSWATQGFSYQSNETHLYSLESRPYRTAWGLLELPVNYMDNQDMWYGRNWNRSNRASFSREWLLKALDSEAPVVFDFHPLHIALNSLDPDNYAEKRAQMARHATGPWEIASCGRGVRSFFEELLTEIATRDSACCRAIDVVRQITLTA